MFPILLLKVRFAVVKGDVTKEQLNSSCLESLFKNTNLNQYLLSASDYYRHTYGTYTYK